MVLVKRKKKYAFKNNRKVIIKKGLSFLPNMFTLANAFFGFCSVVFSAKLDFLAAGYFILLGALMDALDGRIARLIGVSSLIGLQLDSLADAISFCFAPSFLIYLWKLKQLGLFGLLVSVTFFLCGILRLARFNVIASRQTIFFLGLPSTIAGCFLVTLFLNLYKSCYENLVLIFLFTITLILSFLMVSSIKFPAFKQKLFRLKNNLYKVFFVLLFAFIAIMQFHKVLLFLFILYFLSTLFIFSKTDK